MAVVYARQSLSVAWSGGKTFIKRDQPWDADSGLVRERPELFTDEPTNVAGRMRGRPPVIERATRAPGEVREAVAREPEPVKAKEPEDPESKKKPGRPKLPRDADGNIIRD